MHAYIEGTESMPSGGATVTPALMQSTPLVAPHEAGNVFSTASPHLQDDIVHQMKPGRSNHNNNVGMQWPKGERNGCDCEYHGKKGTEQKVLSL